MCKQHCESQWLGKSHALTNFAGVDLVKMQYVSLVSYISRVYFRGEIVRDLLSFLPKISLKLV